MDKFDANADNVKPLPQAEISNAPKADNKIGIFRQILNSKRQNF